MTTLPVPEIPNPLGFSDVSVRFDARNRGEVVLVTDFSLEVAAGAIVALAGRSGSGKSSLLSLAAGLAEPTAGQILWWNEPIGSLDADARARLRAKKIGYLDQRFTLINRLSVRDNILLPTLTSRYSAAERTELHNRVEELSSRLGIADLLSERPTHLSGGERQRVALARTVITSPKLLILDEPTASLDTASALVVCSLLTELRELGTAILVATHDPHVVAAASHVIHLD